MLTKAEEIQKRVFDITFAVIGIGLTWWLMVIAWIVASVETRSNGLFSQIRIGRVGEPFSVYKIKTMNSSAITDTTVTTSRDKRITESGQFMRKTKIDELPQLFNVLFGAMSFVGPRPDVPGFADVLQGEERAMLQLRPGITGPASLKYKDEEELLAQQENPEEYNRDVIWPDKVKINIDYMQNWSLKNDIMLIIKTIIG